MLKSTHTSNYKILLPVCITIIITLMIVTTAMSFKKMESISKQMIAANHHNTINSNYLRTMTESSLNRALLLLEMIEEDDAFVRDEIYQETNELATEFTIARENLLKQTLSKSQSEILDKQSKLAKINVPIEHKIYDLLFEEKFAEAKFLFYNKTVENRYKNIRNLEAISNIQQKIGQESFIKLKKMSTKALQTIWIFELTTFLICITLIILIVQTQKTSHSKLTKLANSDVLTGLPNRMNLIENVTNTIATKPKDTFALIFLDIDYFKSINDNYGHDVGDEILKQFSHKISLSLDSVDVLSRFGGDEFVILLRSINSPEEAVRVIHFLSESLDTSFNIDQKEIFISSSIGATIYSLDSNCKNAKTLLKQADNAMYQAKEAGRNCYYLFSEESYEKMKREHSIEHALHSILKNNNQDNQLFIKYQPLYDLRNQKVAGFEALIRWHDNNGNEISPQDFIPIAEKTHLIEKVNLLVIKEVCKQKAKWNSSEYDPKVKINFNLSGNKSSFSFLINEFKKQMKVFNLTPDEFGMELTERTILDISDSTSLVMNELREQGLKISIDDFGTGYSSLSYLKKLPITTLKIDKSFISGIPFDTNDIELVKTIITLGKSFKLDIIAEGVETQEQLDFLKDHTCKLAQGYFLDKPLNINELKKFKQSDYTMIN